MNRPPEAGRIFRVLTRLLPEAFRRRHAEEMAALVEHRLSLSRGAWARARVRTSAWIDVVRTAVGLRANRRMVGAATRAPWTTLRTEGGDVDGWIRDLGHAARRLVATPFFTLAGVTIVALGVGANATVFSVVDGLLFRPLPYTEPEALVSIYQDSDDGEPGLSSFPAYRDMAGVEGFFDGVAAVSPTQVSLETDDGVVPLSAAYATASYFPVLGLTPARGRWFGAEHDVAGGPPAAVVSHRFWRESMGADPDAIGGTLRLNGQSATVMGVAPEALDTRGAVLAPDIWLSISATVVGGGFQVANLERRQDHWYDVKARLAPGVTVARVQAAMDGLAARLAADFPDLNRGRGITVFSLTDVRVHPQAQSPLVGGSVVLAGIAALVLLLACSNFGNLLLVRGLARSPELAVRRAMGASGGAVARLLLLESLLVALVAGAVGIGLAVLGTGLLARIPLPTEAQGLLGSPVDGRVVAFSLGLSLLTGLVFGLAPALRAARADLAGVLREQSRGSSSGRGVVLVRGALVVVQVAVSVVLVTGTGLLARSLGALAGLDPGFAVDRTAYVRTSLSQGGVPPEEYRVVLDELLAAAGALPGVSAAAAASRLPMQDGSSTTTLVEGYEPRSGTGAVELPLAAVSPGHPETLGLAVLEGRAFGPDDVVGGEGVVMVDEVAARRFWPNGGAVGGRVRRQADPDAWLRVVGVVSSVPVEELGEAPRPMLYFPASQYLPSTVYLVVRTGGDPASVVSALREVVPSVRGGLPVLGAGTLSGHLGDGLAAGRLGVRVLGAFSLLALLLASLGIYAVVSFGVARRTSEMGIRAALGASRERLTRMVVREASVTVLVGVVVGMALALLAAPALSGVLFGVSPRDPMVLAGTVAVMMLVALVAAGVPARRAARVDPVVAFRVE